MKMGLEGKAVWHYAFINQENLKL